MPGLKRHPLVRADLESAFNWYEDLNPDLGEDFASEFRGALLRLQRNPEIYSIRFADVRRANMYRFPYGLFYVIREEEVWLLAVLRGSRDAETVLRERRATFQGT